MQIALSGLPINLSISCNVDRLIGEASKLSQMGFSVLIKN
jgi:hypothetical protein